MLVNSLRVLAGLPLVVAATVGLASSANAAQFATGSTLNITGSLQLDSSNPADPKVLFCDFGTANPAVQATAVVCEPVGSSAQTFVPANGTLDFGSVPGGTIGFVESFGQSGPTNIASFLTAGSLTFSLDKTTIVIVPGSVPNSFEFTALGTVSGPGFDPTPVIYDGFTAQGLFDDGVNGGDFLAADLITGIGSYSGTIITVLSVPEPSSVISLVALGGLGLAGFVKRQKSN
jgi:hypothetical protein